MWEKVIKITQDLCLLQATIESGDVMQAGGAHCMAAGHAVRWSEPGTVPVSCCAGSCTADPQLGTAELCIIKLNL